MSYYDGQFRRVDAIDEALFRQSRIDEIATRARKILEGRTVEQLEVAAEIVEWMIDEFYDHARTDSGSEDLARGDLQDVWVLRQQIDAYDFSDDSDFPNARRHEFFAVVALWLAIDAHLFCFPADEEAIRQRYARITSSEATMRFIVQSEADPMNRAHRMAESAVDAMEALCIAEQMEAEARSHDAHMELLVKLAQTQQELAAAQGLAEEQIEIKAKEKVSRTAAKNGAKAHVENRRMKDEAFAWFAAHRHEFPTLESMAPEITKLCPVAWRTARKWLTEFNRKLSPLDSNP